MIKADGFIVIDKEHGDIIGIGATVERAFEDAKTNAGMRLGYLYPYSFGDLRGNERFEPIPATHQLLDEVERRGPVGWYEQEGVACLM